MVLAGWPTVNFATQLHNLTVPGTAGLPPSSSRYRAALAIPRFKYTFLAEFQLNPTIGSSLATLTNVGNFIKTGLFYGQLKSIDYPKINYKVEKLRSYNKMRNVPVKVEYSPCTMSFHDDATSFVAALWKEYMNFYHQTGNIGSTAGEIQNQNETSLYMNNEALIGPNARNEMPNRMSLGMKLRPATQRCFFESITIYDLGTEPDSVNIHTLVRPIVSTITHDTYDWNERNTTMGMAWEFEVEGVYSLIGQNVSTISPTLAAQLNDTADVSVSSSTGHAIMNPTSSQPVGQSSGNVNTPPAPDPQSTSQQDPGTAPGTTPIPNAPGSSGPAIDTVPLPPPSSSSGSPTPEQISQINTLQAQNVVLTQQIGVAQQAMTNSQALAQTTPMSADELAESNASIASTQDAINQAKIKIAANNKRIDAIAPINTAPPTLD